MSQPLAEISAFKPQELSLVDGLAELEKYGNPDLSKMTNGGWHCRIAVFVTGQGTEFKVMSEYKHDTHTEAVNLCYKRLMTALKRIKDTE